MSFSEYPSDDPVFAALHALQCPPDEVADALGIDIRALWGYQLGTPSVPPMVLRRLVALLEDRASLLREVAAMLDSGRPLRRLAAVS